MNKGVGGGTCSLFTWKCCEMLCAVAVIVKRSVDLVGVVHLVVLALCFEGDDYKKVVNLKYFRRKKVHPQRKSWPLHLSLEKILRAPTAMLVATRTRMGREDRRRQ